MKKKILLFGGNSFLGKFFFEEYAETYDIICVYKNNPDQKYNLNFEDTSEIKDFCASLKFSIDAVLFLQGINPSKGVHEIVDVDFMRMLKINLITPTLILRELSAKIKENGVVIFFSSIAKRKGSYDPSYAASKSGLIGLMHSLANAYSYIRFNTLSLGLVEHSPVFNSMTEDFRKKHSDRMFNKALISPSNIMTMVSELIQNVNINRTDIEIDGGYS